MHTVDDYYCPHCVSVRPGNWGDLYPAVQRNRIKWIGKTLQSKSRFMSFPQTLYYKSKAQEQRDSQTIKAHVEKSVGLSQSKQYLTFMWRQEDSFRRAEQLYPFATNVLIPDIALFLGLHLKNFQYRNAQHDVRFLMRWDSERLHQLLGNVTDCALGSAFAEVYADTSRTSMTYDCFGWRVREEPPDTVKDFPRFAAHHTVDSFDYDKRVNLAVFYMEVGRILVTDRLHGSLLAAMLNIKHIPMENLTKKTYGCRQVAFDNDACSSFFVKVHSNIEGALSELY